MKKKILLIVILLLLSTPQYVKGATGNLKISCDATKLSASQSTNCIVSGTIDTEIDSIIADINLSDNLKVESFNLNDTWEGSDIDDNKISIYPKSGDLVKGNFTIGTFKIKAKDKIENSNEQIKLSSIIFYHDEVEYKINDTNASIRIPSDACTVSNITVSGGTLTFKEDTYDYDLIVDNDKTKITVTKKDNTQKVTGDGEKTLQYGKNTFIISITSESGTSKNYTLNITRPDNRSKDNDLLSFAFSNYDIKFDKNKTDYNLIVDNKVSKLAVCYEKNTKEDLLCINKDSFKIAPKSDFKVIFNQKDVTDNEKNAEENYILLGDLNFGNNSLKITVISENEDEKTYTFTIGRKDANGNIDKSDDEITTNTKTGTTVVIIVGMICLVAFIVLLYFSKKIKK